VKKHGNVDVGQVAVTRAGDLPCRYVIHAVGPHYNQKNPAASAEALRSVIHNSLAKADSMRLRSIALPAISSGIFGYPKDECAKVFFEAVPAYLRDFNTSLELVRLTNYDSPTTEVFQAEFTRQFNVVQASLGIVGGEVTFQLTVSTPGKTEKPVRSSGKGGVVGRGVVTRGKPSIRGRMGKK
jgi:hypothetical protein